MWKALTAVPPAAWLLVSAVFYAGGEFLSKKWALAPGWGLAAAVLAAYGAASLLWLPALHQRNELAVMGTAWLLLATVATILIGHLVFHEALGPRQWLGVALALAAMALLCL